MIYNLSYEIMQMTYIDSKDVFFFLNVHHPESFLKFCLFFLPSSL